MNREYYLELAKSGLRMPIGTDLVLHEHADAKAIAIDGKRLGRVLVEAAHRYRTPLAMPLMDLTREKAALLRLLGIEASPDDFHFHEVPDPAAMQRFERGLNGPIAPAIEATVESVRNVARGTQLVPLGISIGPFSLATKLLADPITPVYLAGTGATTDDEPEVKLLEMAVDLSTRLILRVIERQLEAAQNDRDRRTSG